MTCYSKKIFYQVIVWFVKVCSTGSFTHHLCSYKSCWQVCLPLGLINCPFGLCIAVGRTVRWLCPGLLSLVRPHWLGNGLHMTCDEKFWIFSPLWGARVLVKVLTLSYSRCGRTFVLVWDDVLSSCITFALWPFVHQSSFWVEPSSLIDWSLSAAYLKLCKINSFDRKELIREWFI